MDAKSLFMCDLVMLGLGMMDNRVAVDGGDPTKQAESGCMFVH